MAAPMSDVEKAVRAARHFEDILQVRYRARGSGLGRKTHSVSRNLQKEVIANLLYIAQVRNELAHEKVDALPDKRKFDEACAALEEFFKEALFTVPAIDPPWTEPSRIGFFPKRLVSSTEKRLYALAGGNVTVYPLGIHWLSIFTKGLSADAEAGYVWMIPQSLVRMEITPLRSKDGLAIRMSVDVSAAVVDAEVQIKAVILSPEQQTERLQRRMLISLQRICAANDFDTLTRSLHDVAGQLRKTMNGETEPGDALSYSVLDCPIVECDLEDGTIEDIKRRQTQFVEESRGKAQQFAHTLEIERLQRVAHQAKVDAERHLVIETQRHELEISNLKAKAGLEIKRLERDLQREEATHKAEFALLTSRQFVEIKSNEIEAQMTAIPLAKARAKIFGSHGGPETLLTDRVFALKELEVKKQMELLRSILTDSKIQHYMKWAQQVGASGAQISTLDDYRKLLEQQLGSTNLQITNQTGSAARDGASKDQETGAADGEA